MKKIFTHQTALRITIECGVDLSGNVRAEIHAEKPNGSVVVFTAVVLDAEKGLIAYDVMDATTLDAEGWWKFCSFITFEDDRSAQGVPILVFVYEGMGGRDASKTE